MEAGAKFNNEAAVALLNLPHSVKDHIPTNRSLIPHPFLLTRFKSLEELALTFDTLKLGNGWPFGPVAVRAKWAPWAPGGPSMMA